MIVVSDTSVIVNLAAIGRLELMRALFSEVVLPEAVRDEVLAGGEGSPGFVEIQTLPWIQTRAVSDRRMVAELQAELDAGEAEAIVLAKELHADLLIDERRGAEVAERLGIFHTGLLGVLLRAKRERHLPLIQPCLEQLTRETTFRMSAAVRLAVLGMAGEA